ncbi:MAG TPA: cysteine desulfurase family protein [Candidatus Saccharimonadales bacterium]|nr:cysteine desulfurase family protein [Candidatus Saccharimonadales bacterium]
MADQPTIYLDHAAATPVDIRVSRAMEPYLGQYFHNPSANYAAAREVNKSLEAARSMVAHWLGAKPAEIVFTAGGTEANNLAMRGVMENFPEANVVVSAIEHDSVLAPAARYDRREVMVGPDGRIDLDDLRRKIDDRTVLVSIGYANNEIGTVQPIREISRIIKEKRASRKSSRPLLFHTDACQAANYLDLHVARLGVDLMTLNGGKMYGPKQTGIIYVKAGLALAPLILGGGQERGLRSGTENVAGAIGFAKALELAQAMRPNEAARLQELRKLFIDGLRSAIPGAVINGSAKYRLPNNVHAAFPGQDNERLLIGLDEAGIMAAAGSACSADSGEPSHVLRAIGLKDDVARASLRFTMGRTTTATMISRTVRTLAELL